MRQPFSPCFHLMLCGRKNDGNKRTAISETGEHSGSQMCYNKPEYLRRSYKNEGRKGLRTEQSR